MAHHHVALVLHARRVDAHIALVYLLAQVFTLAFVAELVIAP